MTAPIVPDLSADGRAAVVEAAAALLREGGGRAVTTRAVAAAAGVPAPTIYRLFGDKDGLMAAVADDAMVRYSAEEAERLGAGGGDPVEELRIAWQTHIDFGLANPDLYALLLLPNPVDHSAASAAGIEVLRRRVSGIAAAGLLKVPVDRAVRMIHAAGSGVVLALLNDPPGSRDETLSAATLQAVLASLLTRQPAPRADDHMPLVLAFTEALPRLPGLSDAEKGLLQEWLRRVTDEDPGSLNRL